MRRVIRAAALFLALATPTHADEWVPIAIPDQAVVDKDKVTIDVLKNDRQLHDSPIKLTIQQAPAHGGAEVVAGKIQYTPGPDFMTEDRLVYRIEDKQGDWSATTVKLRAESELQTLERIGRRRFRLRRSFAPDDQTKGAAFSLLRTEGAGTVWSSNFALLWDPKFSRTIREGLELSYQGSIEGALTSKESDSENALRFRGTAFWDTGEVGPFFTTKTATSLKYESSQDFDTQKIMLETLWTPSQPRWGIGGLWPRPPLGVDGRATEKPWVQLIWRPYVGFDAGYAIRTGETAELDDSVLRLVGRLRASVLFNSLAEILKVRETSLFVDNTYRYLALEDEDRSRNFFQTGAQVKFTDNFTFALVYKNGEDAPKFQNIETLGFEVGILIGGN